MAKIDCPYCGEIFLENQTTFDFKLVPTYDHPKSGCCNLCEAVIIEACSMEKRGDEENEDDDYYL